MEITREGGRQNLSLHAQAVQCECQVTRACGGDPTVHISSATDGAVMQTIIYLSKIPAVPWAA